MEAKLKRMKEDSLKWTHCNKLGVLRKMFPFVILNDIKCCLEMLLGSTTAHNKKVRGMFSMNLNVCFFFVPGKNLKDYVTRNQYYPGLSHL